VHNRCGGRRIAIVRGGILVGVLALLASGCLVGVGDPYYPTYGNGGYDVKHYDLAVRYDPATDVLHGVATIDARATEGLARFDLDLLGLTVHRVTVDGASAHWSRVPHELTVAPAHALARGELFQTVVEYSGVPEPTVNGGFVATPDGAFVSGEPEGAATWFPANDHPIDKATYTFRVTVPSGVGVIANGLPRGAPRVTSPGWTTHIWQTREPMASYLATIDIGNWDIRERRTSHGLPIIDAVDPKAGGPEVDATLAREGEMVDFLADTFGPYPFEAAGAIVEDIFTPFALETQTRPTYPGYFFFFFDRDLIVVHELAHQWFGDSVSVARWQDIWLNEGFATYAEWLWAEHEGLATANDIAVGNYEVIPAADPFWHLTIGDPKPEHLFDQAVYYRGGMTLQALRNAVGDDAFFTILRDWARTKRNGNGTTAEFIALAEQVAGRQLDALFQTWLFTTTKPAVPPGTPVALPSAAAASTRTTADYAQTWGQNFARRLAAGMR
jgi:aminopeptidase N